MLLKYQHLADQAAKRFRCDICYKVLSCTKSLTRHKKAVHGSKTSFPCEHEGCDMMFETNAALYTHYFDGHGSLPKLFVCKSPGCEQR